MVSQLERISLVKPDFNYIKDVYEVCLAKYLADPKTVSDALRLIGNGRKILQSDKEVNTYIAFYGAHHYYKLVEAFDALDMSIFCNQKLEVISYGCGAATDTCSLISYCRSKQINLPFSVLTLIEPSQIALERGIEYIKQALSIEEFNEIKINKVDKVLNNLQNNDFYFESETVRLHIFSNVLDIESINLNNLALLIQNTQKTINYFICINPQNYTSNRRIDEFYEKMVNLFKIQEISKNDLEINGKKIWMMTNNQYINCSIPRYHRIFKTDVL